MGKPLTFKIGERELAFQMDKVDRAKLYGYKELEVLDESGHVCDLATLAGDGHTVIGRGGTGIGYLTQDGLWCERSTLKPVDLEGNEIQPVTSSFATAVPLSEQVTVEHYLEHNIRSIYVLACEESCDELATELRGGVIYKFPYSFRGGLEADAGFLLGGEDGNIYLAVGNEALPSFVGLTQAAGLVTEEEDVTEDGDEDPMDFGMI